LKKKNTTSNWYTWYRHWHISWYWLNT